MAKKRKFHKIVIHPNRYLIWTCAITLIVAASLVAYIRIGDIISDINTNTSLDVNFWHTYKDANMSMRYPGEWLVESGTGFIEFGTNSGDSFMVFSYTPPNDPAYDSYSKLSTTQKITVDNVSGIRVASDRNSNQRIAFVKTSKVLYEFRGSTEFFDQILKTVKFVKK